MIQVSLKDTNDTNFGPFKDLAEVEGGRAGGLLGAPDAINDNNIFIKK
jgi:hypothetical protein